MGGFARRDTNYYDSQCLQPLILLLYLVLCYREWFLCFNSTSGPYMGVLKSVWYCSIRKCSQQTRDTNKAFALMQTLIWARYWYLIRPVNVFVLAHVKLANISVLRDCPLRHGCHTVKDTGIFQWCPTFVQSLFFSKSYQQLTCLHYHISLRPRIPYINRTPDTGDTWVVSSANVHVTWWTWFPNQGRSSA